MNRSMTATVYLGGEQLQNGILGKHRTAIRVLIIQGPISTKCVSPVTHAAAFTCFMLTTTVRIEYLQ